MTPRTHYVSSLRLVGVLTAVGLSREFIRHTLTAWQLTDQVESAELIISELVTNAVKETGVTDASPKWEDIKAKHIIGVQVRLVNDALYVEVWDRGDGSPTIPNQSDDAEGGRGLFLVDALSEKWDVYRPRSGGKVVWAELDIAKPLSAPLQADALPQREPGSHGPSAGQELASVDMALSCSVSLMASAKRSSVTPKQ